MYKDFIERTLEGAKQIALSFFNKTHEVEKGTDPNQVLTEADLAIGQYIIEQIKKEYPDYNIVDEEAGVINKGSRFTFVIDPIDGTSNFANGLPHYGCMFGLLDGANPIAGGIVLPSFDEIYYAEKGCGTWLNGRQIHVTNKSDLAKTLGCYWIDGNRQSPERTYSDGKKLADLALKLRNIRITNSIYDVCKFAEGKYSVVIGTSSKIWDNVVAQMIVEEAGGVYLDGNNVQMRYTDIFNVELNYEFKIFAPQFKNELQT